MLRIRVSSEPNPDPTLILTLTRYVYIADRLKELIKYKGHQVAAHSLAYVPCTKSRT